MTQDSKFCQGIYIFKPESKTGPKSGAEKPRAALEKMTLKPPPARDNMPLISLCFSSLGSAFGFDLTNPVTGRHTHANR